MSSTSQQRLQFLPNRIHGGSDGDDALTGTHLGLFYFGHSPFLIGKSFGGAAIVVVESHRSDLQLSMSKQTEVGPGGDALIVAII